jgi:transcriptional regulator with XRE-family HTH domain
MASDRLKKALRNELTRLGDQAKEKIALKAGVSVSTLRNIEAGHMPRRGTAYKVALACDGIDEASALEIAKECDPDDEGQQTA